MARRLARSIWSEFLLQKKEMYDIFGRLEHFCRVLPESGRILATHPLTDEIDTLDLLVNTGREIYIPRIMPEFRMEFLLGWKNGESVGVFQRGSFGILEPDPSSPAMSGELTKNDVVFIPSLAVAPGGYRLGRGGGYFDRLHQFFQNSLTISLLPEKLVDLNFLYEEHDLKLDRIITESRIVDYNY